MLINNAINKFILIGQVVITYLVLMTVYMILVLACSDFGIDGLLGFLIIHPLMGSAISLLTILICYVLGMALRKNPNLNLRIQNYYILFAAAAVLGIVLIILSCMDSMSQFVEIEKDGVLVQEKVPDTELAISGWFITAFSLMHIFPQQIIKKRIQRMLGNLSGKQVIDISELQRRNN